MLSTDGISLYIHMFYYTFSNIEVIKYLFPEKLVNLQKSLSCVPMCVFAMSHMFGRVPP